MLLALWLVLWSFGAEVPSLAVLPLGKAAGSQQFDGLGQALAGMLVSDLATLPQLRLVERDRLDALVAEMKLADSAFLDPKSAQKLGKGVGARYLLVGSYSVVGEAFVMDARIVEVESGEIRKAAAAHGTLAEFVAVEKEVVEAMAAGLDLTLSSAERRKLMLQAPTERFSAFAAWGEGLARRKEGQLDAAKAAFERAVSEDPAFTEAKAALDGLSATVAGIKTGREDEARAVSQAAHAAVLAAVPDERTRPADFEDTTRSVAEFALRLGVLENEGLECQRYAEMRHYLDRVAWKVDEPPRAPDDPGVMTYVLYRLAQEYGLDKPGLGPNVPEHLREGIPGRIGVLWRETALFVVGGPEHRYKRTHALLSALDACHPPRERLREIDSVLAHVRKHGVADAGVRLPHFPIRLDEWLDLAWARTRAEHFGADAELTRRTEALLTGRRGDADAERILLGAVEDVLKLARAWEDHQVRRRGQSEEEVLRRMRLVAEGKLADTPVCAQMRLIKTNAVGWVSEYERQKGTTYLPSHVDMAFMTWAPPADFGCIAGVAARYRTSDAIWPVIDAARSKADSAGDAGTCASQWASFEQLVASSRASRSDPAVAHVWAFNAALSWSSLVYQRCVKD